MSSLSTPRAVRKWFLAHIRDADGQPYSMDKDQARAILDQHQNTLVTARAGSGKTRTTVAKIIFLICYRQIKPSQILAFAFNRAAAAEINQRLGEITYDDQPVYRANRPSARLATTFHSFACRVYNKDERRDIVQDATRDPPIIRAFCQVTGRVFFDPCKNNEDELILQNLRTFIDRAEQKYLGQFDKLRAAILAESDPALRQQHLQFFQILQVYLRELNRYHKMDFNQLLFLATQKLRDPAFDAPQIQSLKYIFIDEYQDFSALFLNLILAIRTRAPTSFLFAVGDDWQAINGFAGSDVEYFQNFVKYFPYKSVQLNLSGNYRSGKLIIKNANFFMGEVFRDFQGSRARSRQPARLYLCAVNSLKLPLLPKHLTKDPLYYKYAVIVASLINHHPGQSIRLLFRRNRCTFDFSQSLSAFSKYTLSLARQTSAENYQALENRILFSTVHKSKGLEADVVIVVDCSPGSFPSPDHNHKTLEIFGTTHQTHLDEEYRLFYVALTRAKRALYLLTTGPPLAKNQHIAAAENLFDFLNLDYFDEIDPNRLRYHFRL